MVNGNNGLLVLRVLDSWLAAQDALPGQANWGPLDGANRWPTMCIDQRTVKQMAATEK